MRKIRIMRQLIHSLIKTRYIRLLNKNTQALTYVQSKVRDNFLSTIPHIKLKVVSMLWKTIAFVLEVFRHVHSQASRARADVTDFLIGLDARCRLLDHNERGLYYYRIRTPYFMHTRSNRSCVNQFAWATSTSTLFLSPCPVHRNDIRE